MSRLPTLLIISHAPGSAPRAGLGMRATHLARALAGPLAVTLATPDESSLDALPGVRRVHYTPGVWSTLAPHMARADVCLLPGEIAAEFAGQLAHVACALVIDAAGALPQWFGDPAQRFFPEQHSAWQTRLARQVAQAQLGDAFICRSERQRMWWLGLLEVTGRIHPALVQHDPTLRSLVDVVPDGLPAALPVPTRPVLKGVHPALAPGDVVLLWGHDGAPWQDPLTAIRAVQRLAPSYPSLRLVFPAANGSGLDTVPTPVLTDAVRQMATDLNLLDRHVIIADGMDGVDWPNVLLESDLALMLEQDAVEAGLAHTNAALDMIWAGLPVVASAGGAGADLVGAHQVGCVVPVGDDAAVAEAIAVLLATPPSITTFMQARAELAWTRAAAPLLAFCLAPRRTTQRNGGYAALPEAARLVALERELATAQAQVQALEQGWPVRVQRWLDGLRRRLTV